MTPKNFTEGELSNIMAKVVDAFMGLKNGSNRVDHFNTLAAVVNIGLVLAESQGQAEVEVFQRAQQALLQADATYDALRSYHLNMAILMDIARGVQGYSELLLKATPEQMKQAGAECDRRLALGCEAKPVSH